MNNTTQHPSAFGMMNAEHPYACSDGLAHLLTNTTLDPAESNRGNPKIDKSNKTAEPFHTAIMHLAPADTSGHEVCPMGSVGCRRACLNTAGRGACNSVKAGRIRRTMLWFTDRAWFKEQLCKEVGLLLGRCEKAGLRLAIRLNGTSDIRWEREFPELFRMFPDVQFYDYTADYHRFDDDYDLPDNYYLLYSRKETARSEQVALELLESGRCNVAIVFRGKTLPDTWNGFPVIDATQDDERFADPAPSCRNGGNVAGLIALGPARHDNSGFVVDPLCMPTKESKAFAAAFDD